MSLLKNNHMRSGNKKFTLWKMSDYVCTTYQDSIFEVGERSEVGALKDTHPLSEYFK